jgi:hypothetical protein
MLLLNNHQKISKPVDNPDHLTILLPTRQRTGALDRMFCSLAEMTEEKSLVDVWVYVDYDDRQTEEYISDGVWQGYGIDMMWYRGRRTQSQGEMNNTLWRHCTSHAGIYMTGTDDYLFVTKGWDQKVREAFSRFPDRIALAFPEDPTALPNMVTFPILSAEWINSFGRVLTNYFPFWFDDTWLDQVAQMIGRKVKLDVHMEPQGGKGKTPRMRNLLFWRNFFDFCTMEDRIDEADLLLRKIYQAGSIAYEESLAQAGKLVQSFLIDAQQRTEKQIAFMEEQYSSEPASWSTDKLLGYLQFESKIVTLLLERAYCFLEQQKSDKVLDLLKTIQCSSLQPQGLFYLQAQCLVAMKQYAEAEQILMAGLQRQPGDPHCLRLLQQVKELRPEKDFGEPERQRENPDKTVRCCPACRAISHYSRRSLPEGADAV